MKSDPITLMLEAIKLNTPHDIWIGSSLETFKSLAGTNKGEIGEAFIERYLFESGIPTQRAVRRTHPWDMKIGGKKFEVKAASLGKNGTFQFNHIRLDRDYRYLLCLGVRPNDILAKFWRKGVVAEGQPGKLVRMAEGQSITFKLTLKSENLEPIDDLPGNLRVELGLG